MMRTMLKDARVNPVRNGMRNPTFTDALSTTNWQGNRVTIARTTARAIHGTHSCSVTTLAGGTGFWQFEGQAGWKPTQGGWGGGSMYVGFASSPVWVRPYVRWYTDPVSFGIFEIPANDWVRVNLFSEEHPEPTFTSSSAYFGFRMYGDASGLTDPLVGTAINVDAAIFEFNKDAGIVNRDIKAPYYDMSTPNMKSDVQAVALGTSITPVM